VKPLVIVTAYNRPQATANCLMALDDTTDFDACTVAVVDDCSEDPDAWDVVSSWAAFHKNHDVHVLRMPENGGTARALNYAIAELREPGQPVVKIDNDMEIVTRGWNVLVEALVEALDNFWTRYYTYGGDAHNAAPAPGLIRAWRTYKDREMPGEEPRKVAQFRGERVCLADRHLGYAVWYTGAFMDRVGYFEHLGPEHRYGFDDVIMGHKVQALGMARLVWEGWRVRDQARGTAVRDKDEHIARARPLLRARLADLHRISNVRATPDGEPA